MASPPRSEPTNVDHVVAAYTICRLGFLCLNRGGAMHHKNRRVCRDRRWYVRRIWSLTACFCRRAPRVFSRCRELRKLGKSEILAEAMRTAHGDRWGNCESKANTPAGPVRETVPASPCSVGMDSLDGLVRKPDNVAILKCVCETQEVKRVESVSPYADFGKVLRSCQQASSRSVAWRLSATVSQH